MKEKNGKVWLAGAGPGDAGLLTVKTRQLMETAEVIVYDALISAEILSLIPPGKQMIHVGKRAGMHMVPQEEINQILLREAQKGRQVLRLKGGDPFVFGRGGEELELLKEHRIPFEIVPGITSATAVPAYAGIPITHRDFTSSFHVITGHPRKDGTSRVDYPALTRLNGTLVFLMGISSMEEILEGLIQAGMEKSTPAAVLEKGTLASQRYVISTVGHLKEEVEKVGLHTPAIILVGQVCALSDTFHWAKDRPLGGRQFLITRPRANSSRLADRLRSLGAQVIELPSIDTRTITPNPKLMQALEAIGKGRAGAGRTGSGDAAAEAEEWLVFTSAIGVKVFFGQMVRQGFDMRRLLGNPKGKVMLAAIGQATAAALKEHGLIADMVPEVYCAASLGAELAEKARVGSRVTIVRAAMGSEELLPPLKQAGLEVLDVPLYETVYETHEQIREKIKDLFHAGEIDAVTFTSASTVKGFVNALGPLEYQAIHAVCIGEQTAAQAKKYGFKLLVSKRASIDGMVELILEKIGDRDGLGQPAEEASPSPQTT